MNSYEATKIWTEERVTIAATVLQVCSLAQNTWDRVLEDRRGCSRVAVCDDLTSDVSRTRSQGWLFDAVIRAVQSFSSGLRKCSQHARTVGRSSDSMIRAEMRLRKWKYERRYGRVEMCGSVSVGRETCESRYAEHRLACHSRSLEADFTATFASPCNFAKPFSTSPEPSVFVVLLDL
jgi:hypothetical protein